MKRDTDPPASPGSGEVDGSWAPTESLAAPGASTLRLDESGAAAGPSSAREPDAAAASPGAGGDRDRELLAREERFRIERLLGEGGMGKVYRAFDTKLSRPVALKVLFASDQEADARFAREAQAQARVDHPHVCKVYETGAIAGRRYIVMQYIEGQGLAAALEGAGIERKVRVLRQVCEGVHAAHRIGLVHRDLKPSNILVTRDDTGDLHPYVVDFGIARDVQAGRTSTGAVVGTPWYMAPEQVAGGEVDRRTDVYALGVTLYQLLSGQLPITGTGSVDVLVRVLREDPVPLARVDPKLPADLQTVVMKCLEKDPARRYDSARALSDDLGRFLDGEPIAARPATLAYRWAKRIRRHRLAFAVGAASVLALLGVAGFAAREAWLARELEGVAASFGAEAERFEWALRAERQMPLHDTRPVEARLRARVERLEREVAALPRPERAPGHYALGRAALVLGDFAEADRLLDRAWADGARAPVVALYRGRAKVELLRLELDRARRLEDRDARRAAIVAARSRYRDDAARSLAAGSAAHSLFGDYPQALLHWVEGRHDSAAELCRRQLAESPFFYEAHLLIGDAELEVAFREEGAGARAEALERAAVAFEAAARIGASDPRPHQRLCSLALARAGFESAPEAARAHLERAARHCQSSLEADAHDAAAVETEAEVRRRLGEVEEGVPAAPG